MNQFIITLTLEDHLPGLQRITGVLNRGRIGLSSLHYDVVKNTENLSMTVELPEQALHRLIAQLEKIIEVSNIQWSVAE